MLILSRRSGERIEFPSLQISVEVAKVKGKTTMVGIEAPEGVKILRGELAQKLQDSLGAVGSSDRETLHTIRNRLNAVSMALHALIRQSESGIEIDSELLRESIEELHRLDELFLAHSQGEGGDQRWLDTPEVTSGATLHTTGDGAQRLAMIVEDNENESVLLAGFLRSAGFRVVTALDGEAAMNYLTNCNEHPDIVLLDMNLPKMNGKETVRKIRENENLKTLRIFAISGYTPEAAKVVVGVEGVNRWFIKPLRPDELVSQIEKDLAA